VEDNYFAMTPISRQTFNTCFYCGCEATEIDYCPPLKFTEIYRLSRESSERLKVPSCYECADTLKKCIAGSLEERVVFAKDTISDKYKTALRIYEMWTETELPSLGDEFRTSVSAGLSLGEEAYNRLKYRGFAFDVEGVVTNASNIEVETFEVFGEVFYDFRDALDYASKAYRIPKNTLKELYLEHDNNFNKAIDHLHKMLAAKEHQKQMKLYCGRFAKDFNQPLKFVTSTVQKFLDEDESLTIQEALDKLAKRLRINAN